MVVQVKKISNPKFILFHIGVLKSGGCTQVT